MNNYTVWGKPIKVFLALSKEQRRAQTQASQQMFNRAYPPIFNLPPVYMTNQPIPNPGRQYPLMSVMQRPNSQRTQLPFRPYAVPPYQIGQYPPVNQVYPNQQQIPPQQMSAPPQQQQQTLQRKVRGGKTVNNRSQRPVQMNNLGNYNDQAHLQSQMLLEMPLPSPAVPLTSQMLASVDEKSRKQIIGERLYPKISLKCPEMAPKITGMLLEMENTELLRILETESDLDLKIQEAISVLQNYDQNYDQNQD